MRQTLFLLLLLLPAIGNATIMACSDEIDEMKTKKEKEGLGVLGEQSCKDSKVGKRARYKVGVPWSCKVLDDYPCVEKPKLRMVQCDREWECF